MATDVKTKKVTCGPNASIFHDPATGVTVIKGQTIELNEYQLKAKRIALALSTGHLILVSTVVDKTETDTEKIEGIISSIDELHKKGLTDEKIADKYILEDLKAACKLLSIEVEDKDTQVTLIQAIIKTKNPTKK